MTRFRITVEYDGTGLSGWQRQDHVPSVQGALETAAARLADAPVEIFGAGRTDAGVHATGQVAHLDIEKTLGAEAVRDGLNFWLRETGGLPIVVRAAEIAPPDFHARFSATQRRYIYRILNRRTPAALERGRVWWVPPVLDAAKMQEAARLLEGHHDFSTFRAADCQAPSPMKTLDLLEIRSANEELHIEAHARSFLHHQVRNMVGTLKLVGEGRWSLTDFRVALEAKDRTKGGPTAPAGGLTLIDVRY